MQKNFFHVSTALVGLDLLYDVPRLHSDTPQSVGLLCTSDQPVADPSLYLTTHITHKRQTFMLPRDSNPQSEQAGGPDTHASDRAATGIGIQNK